MSVFDYIRHVARRSTSPLGRIGLRRELLLGMWPLLYPVTGLYRRTLLRAPRLVAVTGSFGKTTTTRVTAAALGMPRLPREGWTYKSHQAHSLFCVMPWERQYVFELGMGKRGELRQYAWMLKPNMTIVTGVGSEHNREVGTIEDIRHEKSQAIRGLGPADVAILNGDDPHVRWMAPWTRARVVFYGFGAENHVRADHFQTEWPHGSRFVLHLAGASYPVRTRLLGRHMAYAALAALAAAHAAGIDPAAAIARIAGVPPTPRRMEPVQLSNGANLICDDYKAAFETMEPAVRFLGELPASRRIVVIGDMEEFLGRRGQVYREMGSLIARNADWLLIVGLNCQPYASGAASAGMPRANIVNCHQSVRAAYAWVRDNLRQGDGVLIKGRFKQRLGRIASALQGRSVACWVPECPCRYLTCQDCPMLERGWAGNDVVC